MHSFLRPKSVLYAVIGILYCLMLLVIKPQEPAVFFLWIVSLVLVVIRLRFNIMSRFIYIDFLLYLGLFWFYDIALFLVLPSMMLLLYVGKFWILLGYLLVWVGFDFLGIESLFLMIVSIIGGVLIYSWNRDKLETIKELDALRVKNYTLEQERHTLLDSQDEISRMSVLTERDRIAQKLHDDLGHELTGALLALRAYEVKQEETSFKAVKGRLEKAVESLKETVHHTKPEEVYGLERFKNMIHSFKMAEVNYTQSGDVNHLKATHWQALLSVLKEALTNIQKHADANEVIITLYVDEKIVRLTITNDGVKTSQHQRGVGLHYMRRRIESLGGMLSINHSYRFTLICVLPLRLEEGVYDENTSR